MNKKIVAVSFLCVMVVVLAGCTPALASKVDTTATQSTIVPIEVTRYAGKNPVRTMTKVSPADAWQIKQCLIELYNAQESGDQTTVLKCISILKSKGIMLDKRDQTLLSTRDVLTQFEKKQLPGFLGGANRDNLSNAVCFFNAIGQGMMFGTFALKFIQAVVAAIQNQTTPFAAFILLLVLLPLVLIAILINDLIPFRILMPAGSLELTNGTVFSIGLLGLKHMKVGANPIGVNLSWFTGLTINIPPLSNQSKPFMFISGFALKAEGVIIS
jgi:hypothetical protein